jgi:hypothetical protein
MTYAGESIQPGWTVWTRDGEELGKVIATDETTIRVKKGGLLGGELSVPRSAVEETESGRVELSVTKDELSSTRA